LSGFFYLDIISFVLSLAFICLIIYLLIKEVYTSTHCGKLVLKIYHRKYLAIFWLIMLLLWGFFLKIDIKRELYNKDLGSFLLHIFFMAFSILWIIDSLRGTQIRENGIYLNLTFIKWNKILAYQWVSWNIIELKVNMFFNRTRKFKVICPAKEEEKLKIDDVLNRYITINTNLKE